MGDMPLVALASRAAAAALVVVPAQSAAPHLPPPVNVKADYQLGGGYALPQDVRVVSRDRLASAASSAYSICYVNAFQTQPGQLRWWKEHHPRALLRVNGQLRHDPGWPDEVLLDTSTVAKRAEIARVMGHWIDRCGKDGFDAVEPDNLDSFSRSKGRLTHGDNLVMAARLATRAHQAGLAIAQKNLAGLSRGRRLKVGFDFAVAEECSRWNECGSYRAAYGRHVIEIEYSDNGHQWFTRACNDHGRRWSIIYRDRNLVTPSHQAYRYEAC